MFPPALSTRTISASARASVVWEVRQYERRHNGVESLSSKRESGSFARYGQLEAFFCSDTEHREGRVQADDSARAAVESDERCRARSGTDIEDDCSVQQLQRENEIARE